MNASKQQQHASKRDQTERAGLLSTRDKGISAELYGLSNHEEGSE